MSDLAQVQTDAVPEEDQASGLRRIFDRVATHWTLVLQPTLRACDTAEALAQRARSLALRSGPTLVIDASRTQIAAALGLRLRYDLEHALAGDCEIGAACASAGDSLRVLPAARALDEAGGDALHARRVADALQRVAEGQREVMLVLPAGRMAWLRRFAPLQGVREALIPVFGSAETGTAVLTAVRQAVGDLDITTFRLLFLSMGEATASRLLSAMAAIAHRHFRATLLAEEPMPGEPGVRVRARPGGFAHGPVEKRVF